MFIFCSLPKNIFSLISLLIIENARCIEDANKVTSHTYGGTALRGRDHDIHIITIPIHVELFRLVKIERIVS